MQIEDGSIVKFLSAVIGVVATALTGLYWYIWRGDRARLKTLEDKMSQAVTLPQVEHIVEKVEKHFKEDHSNLFHGQERILTIVGEGQKELKEYIKDMFEAREGHWNGRDRRKQ